MKNCKKLNSHFVTGFIDAESCFRVSIYKNNKLKTGWGVRLFFEITLSRNDLALLNKIHLLFGVGQIRIRKSNKSVTYSVSSIKDLINVIIPFFDKYPLITQKKADFELFKQVLDLVNKKQHLTMEGLHKILSIRASIN
jgi:hypothetical protein